MKNDAWGFRHTKTKDGTTKGSVALGVGTINGANSVFIDLKNEANSNYTRARLDIEPDSGYASAQMSLYKEEMDSYGNIVPQRSAKIAISSNEMWFKTNNTNGTNYNWKIIATIQKILDKLSLSWEI